VVEDESRTVEVVVGGRAVARSKRALQVLETSHPPGIYVPIADVVEGALIECPGTTFCEYKGTAVYWDVRGGDTVARRAAWSYPAPTRAYSALAGYISFYPGRVDECRLGGEVVDAQEGDFYGGWVTADLVGPFKGAPGTNRW
jgi:uncharacterized protein (DUF427 family)